MSFAFWSAVSPSLDHLRRAATSAQRHVRGRPTPRFLTTMARWSGASRTKRTGRSACERDEARARGDMKTVLDEDGWKDLQGLHEQELVSLEINLQMGQTFRWKQIHLPQVPRGISESRSDEQNTDWHEHESDAEGQIASQRQYWAGVIGGHAVLLRQIPLPQCFDALELGPLDFNRHRISYKVLATSAHIDAEMQNRFHERMREYFHLDVCEAELRAHFAAVDERYSKLAPRLQGVRLLRTDPLECLFSFICSSNNNIKRIATMVHFLASEYGEHLLTLCGVPLYAFPTLQALQRATEVELRHNETAKFGYRAKFIVQCVEQLTTIGAEKWLEGLKSQPRAKVSDDLVALSGIGRKVASCIALLSLDKFDEIPVDTHVWQFTQQYYMPWIEGKSLTDRLYFSIGDFYREKFGPYAGLAHNLLFAADLRAFQDRLLGLEAGVGTPTLVSLTTGQKLEALPLVSSELKSKRSKDPQRKTQQLSFKQSKGVKKGSKPLRRKARENAKGTVKSESHIAAI
ncbi:N-glycosylase/DNA lyase OGG1 [Porphyridium purpureum]|uniref:DNA-(apurinic or apyrimidinic site) lyase n=1 Tax=Porphyridium purpureum TaxID=35688 RepID=A0A5J4YZA2_PORPP|nr:N-glycosylase/DNA lyase OGG1 [Porphyridium purpureum]|eukprot:POR3917..scf209_3